MCDCGIVSSKFLGTFKLASAGPSSGDSTSKLLNVGVLVDGFSVFEFHVRMQARRAQVSVSVVFAMDMLLNLLKAIVKLHV
jgi:hypothetical protein